MTGTQLLSDRRLKVLRALRDGAILAGWLLLGYVLLLAIQKAGRSGFDAFAYWSVDRPDVYAIPHGGEAAFLYSPPVALVADLFDMLPWPAFLVLWTTILVGCVIWIGRSPIWIAAAFAFPAVILELDFGNIHILMALAIVLGFAHPWTWSFILLTKPTAGVGLLWFAARREWRALGIALGVTAILALVSWLIAPGLWADYIARLLDTPPDAARPMVLVPLPLWLRMVLAAALVVWGARTDRRWTVPIAVMVALPVAWFIGAAVLLAIIPELRGKVGPRFQGDPRADTAAATVQPQAVVHVTQATR
jgi:hypothetical protein